MEYLLRDKRTTLPKVREAIRKVCTLSRPVLLAYDGLNRKEDVGGAMGFPDFLGALKKGRESVREWAEETEWKLAVTESSL